MLRKYAAHNSLLPFYLAWQVNPSGANYNLNFSYQLNDSGSVDLLVEKLQKLIQSNAYLRQTFILENGLLMACIHDHLSAEINYFLSSAQEFAELEQKLVKEPHDISAKSSIRLNIIRFNDSDSCIILFNVHHIIMDGLSLSHFIMELNHLIAGKKIDSESAEEYIFKISHEPPLQEAGAYPDLNEYIKEINEITGEISYPAGDEDDILFYTNTLPDEIVKNLTTLSKQHQVSIYNLLLLAWGSFTAKLFNQKLALINYPVNARTDKSMLGCFVNVITLPLRFSVDDTFLSLMNAWSNKISVFKQEAQFKLNDRLNIDTIPSFSYSNVAQPEDMIIRNNNYIAKVYPQIANSNLSIKYREKSGKFYFICEIFSGLFPDYFASSLLERFFNYLNKLLTSQSARLSSIDLTFTEEKRKLLYDFNETDDFYPTDKTLIDLFDEIVTKYPYKIAVKAFNGEISYCELNNRAEKLASFLISKRVKPEDIIGILIDNRLEMVVAVMAVLKSGAAYLPITNNIPIDNISNILKDNNVKFLLTLPHLAEGISTGTIKININKEISNSFKYIKPSIKSNNLAYMINTSGTTGKPKGVLIEHKAIINVIFYYLEKFSITSATNCSKYAEFGFDASIIEIFPALLSGATLHIIPDRERKDILSVTKFFANAEINFGFLPTQFAELFLNFDNKYLQNLIVAGEKLNKYKKVNFNVVNAYGTTETSVHATSFIVDRKYDDIPIGKPINNVKCYIVDDHLNLIPIGMIGELMIGGESLARGYLHRPDLTSQKFIANPFQTGEEKVKWKNVRLYKTGDLVRFLPDGNLEYIGRNDFQVKIRGYRIELGYIESKIMHYPEILKAIVLIKNYLNDKYLVAYYTATKKIDEKNFRDYLSTQLPEYMQPTFIIYLEEFPLTINGKLDKNAFPEVNFSDLSNYIAPSNYQEQLVCEAFSKILGLEKVGVNDDFFKLGGNSIKAITLISALQDNFNINVADIYHLKTPNKISKKFSLEKNNLIKCLEKIKLAYQINKADRKTNQSVREKLKNYRNSICKIPENIQEKLLNSVLLTGSTGFLGCNLLNELLNFTNYKIFLLVRAKSSSEAFSRIDSKFQFYFNRTLKPVNNHRLFVFASDIEKTDLSLSKIDYQTLAGQVDSIIHSAAITKHYGESDKFYSANVQATINLLEFCKLTRLKDFHYISTISVFNEDYFKNCEQTVFTEDDMPGNVNNQRNIYIKTKCQGEEAVINYRQYGINSNIYRTGNLAFMAGNFRAQENSEDNGFLNRIKCILNLGMIAEEISLEEVSPVDWTAQAIVKLFNKKEFNNQICHVFNPGLFSLSDFFSRNDFLNVKIVSITQFIDTIVNCLKEPAQQGLIERFLVHQGWFNEWHVPLTFMQILQDRTHLILQRLGFAWAPIDYGTFEQYIKKEIKNGKRSQGIEILEKNCPHSSDSYLLGR